MDKGKIIYLSGVSSTGKTSIVKEIQSISDEFFYAVGSDIFIEMVGDKYLEEDYWKYESEIFIYMYHFAKLLSDFGKNVLIDSALFETPELPQHYIKIRDIFHDSPLTMVEVFCPLEICRERNIKRGDREEDQSDRQDKIMDKNVPYDFSVNTGIHAANECAQIILKKVFEI